jgi:hypothetical protein
MEVKTIRLCGTAPIAGFAAIKPGSTLGDEASISRYSNVLKSTDNILHVTECWIAEERNLQVS